MFKAFSVPNVTNHLAHWGHGGKMKKTSIGGQALLEGLLMMGPNDIAIAIRKLREAYLLIYLPCLSLFKRALSPFSSIANTSRAPIAPVFFFFRIVFISVVRYGYNIFAHKIPRNS
jgi:hypothetical protein